MQTYGRLICTTARLATLQQLDAYGNALNKNENVWRKARHKLPSTSQSTKTVKIQMETQQNSWVKV